MRINKNIVLMLLILSLSIYFAFAKVVQPTTFWSRDGNSKLDGQPIPLGAVIKAYDPDDILCGQAAVTSQGQFSLECAGDDPDTSETDEGAANGNIITFYINESIATVTGDSAIWQEADWKEVNITASTCNDADSDGYSLKGSGNCCGPSNNAACSADPDCDDNNASINPGAAEVCNNIDDNCAGGVDDGVKLTFYNDSDSDNYGNINSTTLACSAPTGFVANNTDCNDNNSSISPNAAEVCNGVDDNCIEGADENPAADSSCDDANPCTNDACLSNECQYANNNNTCDDGQYCTLNDACSGGECLGALRGCSANDIPGIAACDNDPDNITYTWDSRDAFTSVCDEQSDACTTGSTDVSSECSISSCNAECETDNDCEITECDALDGCIGNNYYDYDDIANGCSANCSCSNNACDNKTITINDPRCITYKWLDPKSARMIYEETCYETKAQKSDGKYAGLARKSSDKAHKIDSKPVSSCLRVDFGQKYDINSTRVYARTVKKACGDGCSGSYCGKGGAGLIFYYDHSKKGWKYVKSIPRSTSAKWTSANIQASTRYILICRDSGDHRKDNLEIDVVQVNAKQ